MLKREDFTRERIDTYISQLSAQGAVDILTHEEREANRTSFLDKLEPGRDIWVFGYGSLLWNPAFLFVEKRPARLYGFHRSFCLRLTLGRGSPEKPGLMLALDRGGSCNGMAFRIAARDIESETEILWMREMITGAYVSHSGRLMTETEIVQGLTFVINRSHSRYTGRLDLEETIRYLAQGEGYLGSCREYLENTIRHLDEMDVRDSYLHKLHLLLDKKGEIQ